jgi:hypothetical protein
VTNTLKATLDEGTTPKNGKLRLNLRGTILERKTIGLNQKKGGAKKENYEFEELRCNLGCEEGSKMVLRNLDLRPPSKVGLSVCGGSQECWLHMSRHHSKIEI